MTDKNEQFRAAQEAYGRKLVARTAFEREAVWLPSLAVNHWNAGQMQIDGKTFVDCVIEGPAVMAVMDGTTFENCVMGATTDVRTLLLKPLGTLIAGVVGMSNCRFDRCRFVQVAFTGGDDLLETLERELTRPGPARPAGGEIA